MPILPILALLLAAQTTRSTDRLPPAEAPPPGEDAPAAVLQPLEALLAASAPAAVLANTLPEGAATIVGEGPDGPRVRRLAWTEFAAQADPRVQERLTDPAVDFAGDVATVWSPYVATRDNRTIRCGVEQATLVRERTGWRVLTLTRSESAAC